MSIGLTLRVAYKETCEICDKIAELTSVIFDKMITTFEIIFVPSGIIFPIFTQKWE